MESRKISESGVFTRLNQVQHVVVWYGKILSAIHVGGPFLAGAFRRGGKTITMFDDHNVSG